LGFYVAADLRLMFNISGEKVIIYRNIVLSITPMPNYGLNSY